VETRLQLRVEQSAASFSSSKTIAPLEEGDLMSDTGAPIYVVDDDISVREGVESLIRSAGLRAETFASAQEFLGRPRSEVPSCLVLDVEMPGLSGLDLQAELAKADVRIPIIFLTGHGNIPMTVRAIKAGALEFLTKPFDDEDLLDAIRQAIDRYHTSPLCESLASFEGIIGTSAALKAALQQVERVAPTESTVLILGETGTGKELIARAIRKRSHRAPRPFVKLNCAAIPFDLLESELFGHERGAFTGAVAQKIGRFEMADTGTLFLDEVGDISLALQPKLLRVLQEQEFERLGSGRTHHVDVRLVAATHRDLSEMVEQNAFRRDLFYRLNVFPIQLPALRERREDIVPLVMHYVKLSAGRMGKHIEHISPETLAKFESYSWPGNIRELQNLVERAVIRSDNGVLADPLLTSQANHLAIALPDLAGTRTSPSDIPDVILTDRECRERERLNLIKALQRTNGRIYGQGGAAELLGINPTTLASRLRALRVTTARPNGSPRERIEAKDTVPS
jgi:DNA-binding NtrC family response regulator